MMRTLPGLGWLTTTTLRNNSRVLAGSRNSLEAACTCEFRLQAVKEVYGMPRGAVIKRQMSPSKFDILARLEPVAR